MPGTFVRVTGSSVRRHAAMIGRAAFLFPAAVMRPERGCAPSMTNDSMRLCERRMLDTDSSGMSGGAPRNPAILATASDRSGRERWGILAGRMDVTRERAWQTLTAYTTSESLLRHALAVEASVRAYARKFGEDEELWGCTALLHDFDYEIHPTLDEHPQDGAPILRAEGYPEVVVEGVLSHAEHTGLPRDTMLKKTLFACDELSGFVCACGYVRPDGIETLEPKSVRKKLKQPSFAAGVSRDDVYNGAEELGVDLDEHIAFVIAALRPIAAELGLRQVA
jgi:putative nucleotidyltransferase with HDIG domain